MRLFQGSTKKEDSFDQIRKDLEAIQVRLAAFGNGQPAQSLKDECESAEMLVRGAIVILDSPSNQTETELGEEVTRRVNFALHPFGFTVVKQKEEPKE